MARWISVVKQTEEQNTHTHRDTHYTVFPRLPHFCQSLWKRFSAGSSYMQQPMTMATQTHDMRVIPVHSRWSISHWNCQRIDSTIIERLPLTQDAMWSRLSSLWIHFCTKGVVFHIMLRRIHAAHQPYPQSCIWFVAFQTINYAWTLMTSQFFFSFLLFFSSLFLFFRSLILTTDSISVDYPCVGIFRELLLLKYSNICGMFESQLKLKFQPETIMERRLCDMQPIKISPVNNFCGNWFTRLKLFQLIALVNTDHGDTLPMRERTASITTASFYI